MDKRAKECGEMTNKSIKEHYQPERISAWKNAVSLVLVPQNGLSNSIVQFSPKNVDTICVDAGRRIGGVESFVDVTELIEDAQGVSISAHYIKDAAVNIGIYEVFEIVFN